MARTVSLSLVGAQLNNQRERSQSIRAILDVRLGLKTSASGSSLTGLCSSEYIKYRLLFYSHLT